VIPVDLDFGEIAEARMTIMKEQCGTIQSRMITRLRKKVARGLWPDYLFEEIIDHCEDDL